MCERSKLAFNRYARAHLVLYGRPGVLLIVILYLYSFWQWCMAHAVIHFIRCWGAVARSRQSVVALMDLDVRRARLLQLSVVRVITPPPDNYWLIADVPLTDPALIPHPTVVPRKYKEALLVLQIVIVCWCCRARFMVDISGANCVSGGLFVSRWLPPRHRANIGSAESSVCPGTDPFSFVLIIRDRGRQRQ